MSLEQPFKLSETITLA